MMNRTHKPSHLIQLLPQLPHVTCLDVALQSIDRLHTAASDGNLDDTSADEIIDILHEVIYIAQETINEVESRSCTDSNKLKVASSSKNLIVLEKVK
jgi:hypothetical protein